MTAKPPPRTSPDRPGYQPLTEWKLSPGWTSDTPSIADHGVYAAVVDMDDIVTSADNATVSIYSAEPTYSMGVRFALNHPSIDTGLLGTVYVFGLNGVSGVQEMWGDYLGKLSVESGPTAVVGRMLFNPATNANITGNTYWAGLITADETSLDTAEFRVHLDPDAGYYSPAWVRITKNYRTLVFVMVSGAGVSMRMAYRDFNSLV